MRVAINQPTYLPWMGYLDLIDQADLFVVLDTVQFEKQSWQHRNRIKTSAGLQWLTVPVKYKGRFGQSIREVEIRDSTFTRNHLRAIELAYRRAPHFDRHFPALAKLLEDNASGLLVDLNVSVLQWLLAALGIQTRCILASSLGETGKRTELLANICRAVGATEYISPLGSAEYLLAERHVLPLPIFFQHYQHPEYSQLFSPFAPFTSVIDLMFSQGENAIAVLRSGRRDSYSVNEVATLAEAV